MGDSAPERDWSGFIGLDLVEVVDQLLEERLEWDPTLSQLEMIARELLRMPETPETIRRAVFREWTSVASTGASSSWRPYQNSIPVHPGLHQHAPYVPQMLEHHLSRSVVQIVEALASKRLALSGIREPGGQHGWTRDNLPVGLLETKRWRLYRQSSLLVPLNPDGGEDTPAFSAVRVTGRAAATTEVPLSNGNASRPPASRAMSLREFSKSRIEEAGRSGASLTQDAFITEAKKLFPTSGRQQLRDLYKEIAGSPKRGRPNNLPS